MIIREDMTVGNLKRLLEKLPDNYVISIELKTFTFDNNICLEKGEDDLLHIGLTENIWESDRKI